MGKQLRTDHPWLRKIAVLILMHLSLITIAQNLPDVKVTFYGSKVPLKTVLANIEKQTRYHFNFSNDDLNTNTIVSVKYDNTPLNIALNELLVPLGFEWKAIDRNIYLSHSTKVDNQPKPATDKLIDIIGRVTDNEGLPLPGAVVQLAGSKQGGNTDNNGYFRFNNIKDNAVLLVSLIGYNKEEVRVNGKQNIAVSLNRAVENLNEKVIIGYGTVSKRLNTGNTSSIKGVEISQQPVPNPLSTLQGRMPGVFVTSGQGLPGTNINIQIRGVNSIAAGKSPLYIIDGVPFNATPLNQWNGGLLTSSGNLSPFNSINPEDLERIDVLKDADATAIYGSRAANGVVLITTKKGRTGKTKFDVNIYTGYEKATNVVKTLNTREYIQVKSEAFKNDGVIPDQDNAPGLTLFSPTAYTNFPKLIVGNTARVTNVQGDLSGGDNNFRFLLGGNFRKEGTVFLGDLSYQRAGGHLSLQHNSINNKFSLNFNTSYTFDRNNAITNASNTNLVGIPPNYPLYDSLGNLNWVGGSNPVASTRQFARNQTNMLITSTQLQYTVADGLHLKASFGYTNTTLNTLSTIPKSSLNPASFFYMNSAKFGNSNISTYIVEPQITYSKKVQLGTIDVVLGGTFQSTKAGGSFIQGQNYSNDGLLQSLSAAGSISTSPMPASYNTDYKYVSGFGRVNYNYQQKYLLNLSFRRDGSSRFGPGKEFGNFGAIGAAWLFTGEDFMQDAFPQLSFGKIRASYGIVGNDQISDYQYLSTYRAQGTYQGTSTVAPSRIANPDYSWEKSKKMEAGLELGFFKDRLFLSGSWYRNKSNNQLVSYPLATQTGFPGYQANLPASIENTGVELLLNAVIVKQRNFGWNASVNFSTVRNKLISFPGLAGSSYSNQYEVGKPITIVKGFDYKYIDPATGIPRFATRSGKDTLSPSDPEDRVIIGNTLPDFYGGVSNSFTFKGISLDFLFQFVKQKGYLPSYWPGVQNIMPVEAINRWQKPGDVTNVPVAAAFQANNDAVVAYNPWTNSNRFWTDASYIRLKNLSVSYNFSNTVLQKYKVQHLRVYLQGQNLLTFTKYKGSDPELASQLYVVPTLKIFTGGIQITF